MPSKQRREEKERWERAVKNSGLIKLYLSKNLWIIQRSASMGYEDYWQAGLLGLYRASQLFDPRKGVKFSTYAYGWVRKFIQVAYMEQGFPVIRIPKNLHEDIGKGMKSKRLDACRAMLMVKIEVSEGV